MRSSWLLVVSVLFSSSVSAQVSWFSDIGQGIRDASITAGNSTLGVVCSITSNVSTSSIYLTLKGESLTGSVRFRFDGGGSVDVPLVNGELLVNTADNQRIYSKLTEILKRARSVAVVSPNGVFQSFSLRGSGKAIGDCPIRPEKFANATEPSTAQPAIGNSANGSSASSAEPTFSQDSATVRQGWNRAVTACGNLMRDPEAYLMALPETGSIGEKVISNSQDGNLIMVDYLNGLITENMQLSLFEGQYWIGCHIYLGPTDFRKMSDISEELIQLLREKNLDFIGGLISRELPYTKHGVIKQKIFQLTVRGVWPGLSEFAEIEVNDGHMYIQTAARIAR